MPQRPSKRDTQARRGRWRAFVAVASLLLLAGSLVSIGRHVASLLADATPDMKREMVVLRLCAKVLGQHLATDYPDVKAVIVTEPLDDGNRHTYKPLIAGLREGYGRGLEVLGVEAPEGLEGFNPMLEDVWPDVDNFTEVIDRHPDCELVISFVGLPVDFPRLKYWRKGRPKFAIVHIFPGGVGGLEDVGSLRKYFRSESIVALMAPHPHSASVEATGKLPRSGEELRAWFDQRYVLIDHSNYYLATQL